MKICISEVTTLPASFADDVAAFKAAGVAGMEVWLTKLEKHLENHSAEETRMLIADSGLALPAAAYQGGLLLSQGVERRTHFDDFRKRLDLCQFFGIETLLVVADFERAVDETSLRRAVVSLTEAARWAVGNGVKLALEFRGAATFCASLDTAINLVAACGEPNVGVCLDLFHFYKGPSKFEDLDRLSAANLAHVQICDVAGTPRELMTDADRILPGDGDLQIGPFLETLGAINYAGWVSLELMNPTLWHSDSRQVVEMGAAAMQRAAKMTNAPPITNE